MSETLNVYMVVNLTINDRDEYRTYEKGFFPFLKKYNGTFLTYDDSPICLEGDNPKHFDRVILFSFPSEEDADNWWADEGYQGLSKHRRNATEITLQRIKGISPRSE